MLKSPKYFISLLLCFVILVVSPATAYSQDEEDESITIDTVGTLVESPVVEDENQISPKLSSITTEDAAPVAARSVDEKKKSDMMNDEAFWYANKAKQKKKEEKKTEEPSESFLNKQWFKTLLWFIIVGSFVVIIIWFLIASNVKLFKKRSAAIEKQEDDLTTENIFDINYEKQLAKAIADKDYRSAIRFMYLQLLKMMSERNIIQYKQERTNAEYLGQLFSTTYYKDFFRMTRNFEYTWYGQFSINEQAFQVIQQDFYNFKSRISK